MRSDRIRTPEPDTPSMIPRIVSAALVLVSIATVFAYPEISGRTLGLPERLNAGIIGLGALAGVLHMLGISPQQRHLRAFAGPVVAWPVMIAGIASLVTS